MSRELPAKADLNDAPDVGEYKVAIGALHEFIDSEFSDPVVGGGAANVQTATLTETGGYKTNRIYSFLPGFTNTGPCTVEFDTLGPKNVKLLDGSDPYAGAITAGVPATFLYNGTNQILLNPYRVQAVLYNYISGFVPTAGADADHDLSFSNGACTNFDNIIICRSNWSSLVKQIDAAWAEGTNQGCMATGTVAADTPYYFNLIRKDSDTNIFDIVADVSSSHENTPAGWTFINEVHMEFTDNSANIQGQTYRELSGGGIQCKLKTSYRAINDTNPGVGLVTKAFNCPPETEVIGTLQFVSTIINDNSILFTEVGSAATEPFSSGPSTLRTSVDAYRAQTELRRFLSSARTVEYEVTGSDAGVVVSFQLYAWINHRRN